MKAPIKDIYDATSMLKDIADREQIILQFERFGILDRENAIRKIKELRETDAEITAVTVAVLAQGAVPFTECTNEQIVNELKMQKSVLEAKLLKQEAQKAIQHQGGVPNG